MFASIETHRDFVRERVAAKTSWLFTSNAASPVHVRIKSGLLGGTAHTLTSRTISIGSELCQDIVLIDDDIQPKHVELSFEPTLFGELVKVTAIGGDIMVGNTKVAEGSSSPLLRPPLNLEIGGVVIRLDDTKSNQTYQTGWVGRILDKLYYTSWVALIAGAALLLPFFLNSFGGTEKLGVQIRPQATQQESVNTEQQKSAEQDNYLLFLAKIEDAGLEQFLNVAALPNGSIQVKGALPDSKFQSWKQVHTWFDQQAFGTVLISNVRKSRSLSKLPSLSHVTLHEPRQVLFADGKRVLEGQIIQDGWVLEKIGPKQLEIRRGNERINLQYKKG